MTYDIEVLKLGKFGLQKNTANIKKYYGERNLMDMFDDKEYDEGD